MGVSDPAVEILPGLEIEYNLQGYLSLYELGYHLANQGYPPAYPENKEFMQGYNRGLAMLGVVDDSFPVVGYPFKDVTWSGMHLRIPAVSVIAELVTARLWQVWPELTRGVVAIKEDPTQGLRIPLLGTISFKQGFYVFTQGICRKNERGLYPAIDLNSLPTFQDLEYWTYGQRMQEGIVVIDKVLNPDDTFQVLRSKV